MHKGLSVLLVGVVLAYGNTAIAREGGGGHHDGHHAKSGGMASEHMGQQGTENSNAQWSAGATKGQERSDLRNHDHHGHEAGGKDQNRGEGKHKGHEHTAKDKSDKNNNGKSGDGNKNGKGGKHGSH
ncbi:hypothetical protein [Nitrosospira sp. NRS527]|uniref:hypothetical protein n=1 Tax=Nitrosospira sp. NRS527 TaxID=155925 RepID=UPI001AF477F3|nr:hypothetical protein [Nitrosospira sp. NRS527]BCT66570.1 hypothetical protein NNRS527_00134 [Nitrosospira sp. NRS527]